MDYGQTIPPTDLPEALTPGSSSHTLEAKDNLDLTNQADQWGEITKPTEHDKKSLGSEALNSFELPSSEPEQELGRITPYLPPDAAPESYDKTATNSKTDADIIENSLNPSLDSIKTTDRLSEESVKVIDESIDKFNQNNIEPASFYEEVRNAMETNIGNSYNRKLGG